MNNDIVERGDIGFVDPRENSVYAEKKYVEVNEAIKTILNASPTRVWDALQILAEMKGTDVAPVRHAHWKYLREEKMCFCTACKSKMNPYLYGYGFCPLCGARMDGKVTADED